MTRPPSDIIGPPLDETRNLPMFDAQRVAAPDVAHEARRAPVAHLEGAGQKARKAARSRQNISAAYNTLGLALALHPEGLTRKELASLTAMNVNGVNARISEMRAMTDKYRVVTDGRRDGQSVCHLAKVYSLTFSEG